MTTIMLQTEGYFLTGTDTGVGKTFVACALASKFVESGVRVGVMKPVETGCMPDPRSQDALLPADATALMRYASSRDTIDLVNPYRFSPALAPSIAARLSGAEISLLRIKESFDKIRENKEVVIVEGAGGLMCPVTDDKTMADVAIMLDLPIIIVAPSVLGVINHVILTARYADSIGLEVKGIILNQPSLKTSESSLYNAREIRRFLKAPILAEIPFSKDPIEAGRRHIALPL